MLKVLEPKWALEKRALGGQIFMSGFAAGRSIYSYTVRVLLIQRRVLSHTERALCLGGIWQHYATQTVKLMNPDWVVQKYVLHETLQALNLTVVNSINHNFSKNICFADLKRPRESPDSKLSIGPKNLNEIQDG
jgi:hypothetical protein